MPGWACVLIGVAIGVVGAVVCIWISLARWDPW